MTVLEDNCIIRSIDIASRYGHILTRLNVYTIVGRSMKRIPDGYIPDGHIRTAKQVECPGLRIAHSDTGNPDPLAVLKIDHISRNWPVVLIQSVFLYIPERITASINDTMTGDTYIGCIQSTDQVFGIILLTRTSLKARTMFKI